VLFLAVAQLAIDKTRKNELKYIYIDDPISSLDDHNAISKQQIICKYVKS
jgi:hypothetical protein